MSYSVMYKPGHVCEVPDVNKFPVGTVVRCTAMVMYNGYDSVCNNYWVLKGGIFSNRLKWKRDWG